MLIHCFAGMSRSATIMIAYLMKKIRVRCDDARDIVKGRRSIIRPN